MAVHNQFTLKARKTGEILDQGVRLYRKNFLTFIGIIAVVLIPMRLINTGFSYLVGNRMEVFTNPNALAEAQMSQEMMQQYFTDIFRLYGVGIIFGLINLVLVTGIGNAAMTRAMADVYLGRKTSVIEAFQRIGKSWLSLLGAFFLLFLLSIPVVIFLIIPCISYVIVPGALIFMWFMVAALVPAVVVMEGLPAGKAFRRAWDLAKRRFWWLFGFMILLYFFNMLVVGGPETILNVIFNRGVLESALSGDPTATTSGMQMAVTSLVNLATNLIYIPLQTACVTLAYFDIRIRLEGFDLALMASETGDDVAQTVQAAPKLEPGRFIDFTDVGRFIALTVGVVVVYAGLLLLLFGLMSSIMGIAG